MSEILGQLKHINIEVTNICSLNCTFCSDKKKRPQGFISRDLYKAIINQCPEDVEIRLFLSGEPLLHPAIDKMINYASKKGHETLIHTNGTKLNEELSKKLINSGLTRISFSIDGISPEDYKKYRGYNFEKLKKKIHEFLVFNNHKIHTTLQCIIPSTARQDHAYKFIYNNFVGYDKLYIRYPHTWNRKGSIPGAPNDTYAIPCFFLKNYMAVYWNGLIPLCCADLNGDYILGDAKVKSLPTLWDEIQKHKQKQEIKENFFPCNKCERYKV